MTMQAGFRQKALAARDRATVIAVVENDSAVCKSVGFQGIEYFPNLAIHLFHQVVVDGVVIACLRCVGMIRR